LIQALPIADQHALRSQSLFVFTCGPAKAGTPTLKSALRLQSLFVFTCGPAKAGTPTLKSALRLQSLFVFTGFITQRSNRIDNMLAQRLR